MERSTRRFASAGNAADVTGRASSFSEFATEMRDVGTAKMRKLWF